MILKVGPIYYLVNELTSQQWLRSQCQLSSDLPKLWQFALKIASQHFLIFSDNWNLNLRKFKIKLYFNWLKLKTNKQHTSKTFVWNSKFADVESTNDFCASASVGKRLFADFCKPAVILWSACVHFSTERPTICTRNPPSMDTCNCKNYNYEVNDKIYFN